MSPPLLATLDLNLLRLFDAIYRTRSVSRGAERLQLTQPAASQGLARLRVVLKDPLFERAPGGVRPTPRAERLADAVRQALALLEQAVEEAEHFDPAQANRVFRFHMSDIGEGRFLPILMAELGRVAPQLRIETMPLRADEVSPALDDGRIDFAFGFLPRLRDTRHALLLHDRYVLLVRRDHPFARRRRRGASLTDELQRLEFVAVRTHADTLRILQLLHLEDRVRLTTEHFLVLPAIVRATDLAAIMPRQVAEEFADPEQQTIVEPPFPLRDFAVSLHWSVRAQKDPAHRWMKELVLGLFPRTRS